MWIEKTADCEAQNLCVHISKHDFELESISSKKEESKPSRHQNISKGYNTNIFLRKSKENNFKSPFLLLFKSFILFVTIFQIVNWVCNQQNMGRFQRKITFLWNTRFALFVTYFLWKISYIEEIFQRKYVTCCMFEGSRCCIRNSLFLQKTESWESLYALFKSI